MPKAPKAYTSFINRYPKLGDAWQQMRSAEADGPLDAKTQRLIKLAVSVGAMREGAVHSGARKALAAGATVEELRHIVALAASTLGLPSAVAIDCWIGDIVDPTS